MKKAFSLLLALIISLSALAACGGETDSKKDRRKDKDKTSVETTQEATEPTDEIITIPIWPEPADDVVSIYMDNSDLWKQELEFAMGGSILFLDLDMDSYPELITTTVQGSGLFSANHYYKVDPDNKTVKEIPCDTGIAYEGDLFSTDYPKLYINNENSGYFYMLSDTIRAGAGAHSTIKGIITLTKDDEIVSETLWCEDFAADISSSSGEGEYTYRIFENGTSNTVSKDAYDKFIADFEKAYQVIDFEYSSIDLMEFNEADENTQYQMLLDCYNSLMY